MSVPSLEDRARVGSLVATSRMQKSRTPMERMFLMIAIPFFESVQVQPSLPLRQSNFKLGKGFMALANVYRQE